MYRDNVDKITNIDWLSDDVFSLHKHSEPYSNYGQKNTNYRKNGKAKNSHMDHMPGT